MAITQFEQSTIDQAAQKHDEMSQEMRGQLQQLKNEVDATLAASTSQATRALQATYDQWFQNVDKMIVNRTNSLSQAMSRTAQEQQSMDEQNSSNITSVASFLAG